MGSQMGIIIEAAVSQAVSYATQDHVPVIRSLTIGNDSGAAVENIKVMIRPEPPFAKAKAITVNSIGP
ncbi:MAG: hypothetical protein LBV13_03505, partial [Methanomassiliicoccaceae archaeon]|nr:hypothetical protein [Methanomassiliicoccaceae archaeon]